MLSPFTLSPFKPISKRWSILSATSKKNPERMSILNRRGSIEEGGRREERGVKEEQGRRREGVIFEGAGGGRKDGKRGGRRISSDLIEGNIIKIRELEGEIGRIKEELYGVLVKMKESLIMDEVY